MFAGLMPSLEATDVLWVTDAAKMLLRHLQDTCTRHV